MALKVNVEDAGSDDSEGNTCCCCSSSFFSSSQEDEGPTVGEMTGSSSVPFWDGLMDEDEDEDDVDGWLSKDDDKNDWQEKHKRESQ